MQKGHPTNMKAYGIFIFFILTHACYGQVKFIKFDKNAIPKSIQYNGKIVEAIRWRDSTGDNIVLLTATKETKRDNEGNMNGALYAYHYITLGDSIWQTWRVYDFVSDCPVDMILNFIDRTFSITDLNQNGQAEVWMMYKVSCQGDVSPVTMKIIMYEGSKKAAVRGTTRVKISVDEYLGGEYTFDETFRKGPAEFREYAQKLWNQNKVETWEY